MIDPVHVITEPLAPAPVTDQVPDPEAATHQLVRAWRQA